MTAAVLDPATLIAMAVRELLNSVRDLVNRDGDDPEVLDELSRLLSRARRKVNKAKKTAESPAVEPKPVAEVQPVATQASGPGANAKPAASPAVVPVAKVERAVTLAIPKATPPRREAPGERSVTQGDPMSQAQRIIERRSIWRWAAAAGIVALAVILIVLLAGCSNEGATGSSNSGTASSLSAATTSTISSTQATTTTTPPVGPVAKTLGQLAAASTSASCGNDINTCEIRFTITKVTDCTGSYAGDPPPSGTHRKLVWIEVETGPGYNVNDLPSYYFTRFMSINAAGVTSGEINPSTFWQCAPKGKGLGFGDENWLPSHKYAGAIEVYLPDDAVKIVNGEGKWEWSIA